MIRQRIAQCRDGSSPTIEPTARSTMVLALAESAAD